ncbi:HAD family hydrolase [Rhizomonospora bruguierae]|uniref:HAD family hydrolase n=1 Tax=Rhizomonospora bruguierae TaxID=1581705 RepID=UPI001BCF1B93|nr:HAD family hydrolase [Micromonospora sp. NBRC 107566]
MSDGAGVLFDVDGTLIDTPYLHVVSWWRALRRHGHAVPMAAIHRAIGMGADKIIDHLLGPGRDRARDGAIAGAHTELYKRYWPELRPLPGAAELLRACADKGLTVVLASSASGEEVAALRRALGADDVVTLATTGDDADQSKPAPDIVQVALDRARLRRERAVFVGDAVWDVRACRRLGLPCVAVTCGGTSEAELRDAGAVAVYRDPADILADLDRALLARIPIGGHDGFDPAAVRA